MKSLNLRFSMRVMALCAVALTPACGGADDAKADDADPAVDAGTGGTGGGGEACPEGQMCMSMEEDYCVQDGQQCLDPALVGSCPEGQMCMSMSEDYCVGAGQVCGAPRKNYAIEIQAPHAHIWTQVGIIFTVRDLDACADPADQSTCAPVPGLALEAFFAPKGGATEVQPLAPGVFDDGGDGTYTWLRTFGDVGAGAIGARFTQDGQSYFTAFGMESSKAGGERYFCDTDADGTPDRAFQIRWAAAPGRPVADGTTAAFTFEIMRSFNTPVNTEQPWTNTFDHLRPAELDGMAPTVELMADSGEAATSMGAVVPVYAGKGLYKVERAFAAGDLGGAAARTFWFKVGLTDDLGCRVDGGVGEDEANYLFSVAAAE